MTEHVSDLVVCALQILDLEGISGQDETHLCPQASKFGVLSMYVRGLLSVLTVNGL